MCVVLALWDAQLWYERRVGLLMGCWCVPAGGGPSPAAGAWAAAAQGTAAAGADSAAGHQADPSFVQDTLLATPAAGHASPVLRVQRPCRFANPSLSTK